MNLKSNSHRLWLRAVAPNSWHTLMHNLATVCRRLGKHSEAMQFYKCIRAWIVLETLCICSRCLALRTSSASVYLGRALCRLYLDEWLQAVNDIHSALAIEPRNLHAQQILDQVNCAFS